MNVFAPPFSISNSNFGRSCGLVCTPNPTLLLQEKEGEARAGGKPDAPEDPE